MRNIYHPPVVKLLIYANVLMFLWQLSGNTQLIEHLALWPMGLSGRELFAGITPRFELWQLLSYAFLHGGFAHIALNMYALWLFGSRIEYAWGSRAFAIYYIVAVLGAGLVQLLVVSLAVADGPIYPTVGASGGVFGLLLAFGLTYPNERLMLIFPPIVMRAKWFVLIYIAIELYAGVTDTWSGVAHFAHLGGMVSGFLLLLYWGRHPLRS